MSCYTCEVCNEMKDGDFEAPTETMDFDSVCEGCATDMNECEHCEAVFLDPVEKETAPETFVKCCPKCNYVIQG